MAAKCNRITFVRECTSKVLNYHVGGETFWSRSSARLDPARGTSGEVVGLRMLRSLCSKSGKRYGENFNIPDCLRDPTRRKNPCLDFCLTAT